MCVSRSGWHPARPPCMHCTWPTCSCGRPRCPWNCCRCTRPMCGAGRHSCTRGAAAGMASPWCCPAGAASMPGWGARAWWPATRCRMCGRPGRARPCPRPWAWMMRCSWRISRRKTRIRGWRRGMPPWSSCCMAAACGWVNWWGWIFRPVPPRCKPAAAGSIWKPPRSRCRARAASAARRRWGGWPRMPCSTGWRCGGRWRARAPCSPRCSSGGGAPA